VLSGFPFDTVASRYENRRVQFLGDVVDLSAVPNVQPQFRVVEVIQGVVVQAGQATVVEAVTLAREARNRHRRGAGEGRR